MTAGTQTGVEQDGIALVGVEVAPGLVGDVEGWQNTAPVQQEGRRAVEGFGRAWSV